MARTSPRTGPAGSAAGPALAGLLSAAQVRATCAAVAGVQEPDGAIPWSAGAPTDVWNHVEAAMALLVGGQVAAAEAAYDWCARSQRPDGSWPMKTRAGVVEDASGETNMSAYLAVGVWHHWLLRRDRGFVQRLWPVVRRGLDFVVGLQLGFGGIAWSQEYAASADGGWEPGRVNAEGLLAGSSSIYQSLRAGVSLAELLGEPQPEWELAGGRLGHALRTHRDLFLDKATFSMDWYYPVLGGAVRGPAAHDLLAGRWDDFVVPGLGSRCVDTNPWVTGAESCELVMALDAAGEHARALQVLADMQHLRREDGGYWTGYVYADETIWPAEHTTYTSGAVVLAVDALAGTLAGSVGSGATAGSGIMRGDEMVADFAELALECGCELSDAPGSADRLAGLARHPGERAQGAD